MKKIKILLPLAVVTLAGISCFVVCSFHKAMKDLVIEPSDWDDYDER